MFSNQPVLSNEGIVSCSRKQLVPLMGFKLLAPTYYNSETLTTVPIFTNLTSTHASIKWGKLSDDIFKLKKGHFTQLMGQKSYRKSPSKNLNYV